MRTPEHLLFDGKSHHTVAANRLLKALSFLTICHKEMIQYNDIKVNIFDMAFLKSDANQIVVKKATDLKNCQLLWVYVLLINSYFFTVTSYFQKSRNSLMNSE